MEINTEFSFQKRHYQAFDIIGFTKIVKSGGELYEETRMDGRWDALKAMNISDGNIYCTASFDSECPEGKYRYTIGVIHNDNFIEKPLYVDQMLTLHVKESDWIVFSIDFESDYGTFWQKDPYKMISDLGYSFNNAVGMHIDVFGATYDGHEMEFWMPIK